MPSTKTAAARMATMVWAWQKQATSRPAAKATAQIPHPLRRHLRIAPLPFPLSCLPDVPAPGALYTRPAGLPAFQPGKGPDGRFRPFAGSLMPVYAKDAFWCAKGRYSLAIPAKGPAIWPFAKGRPRPGPCPQPEASVFIRIPDTFNSAVPKPYKWP